MFSHLVLCAICDTDITAMAPAQREEHYMTCDRVSRTGVVLVDLITNFVRHHHTKSLTGDGNGAYIPDLYRLTDQYGFEDHVVDDCIRGHMVSSGNFYWTPNVEQHLKMCAIESPPGSDDDEEEEDGAAVEAFIQQVDREARASARAGRGTFSMEPNSSRQEQAYDMSNTEYYKQMFDAMAGTAGPDNTFIKDDPNFGKEVRDAAAAQGFVCRRDADGSIAFVNPDLD